MKARFDAPTSGPRARTGSSPMHRALRTLALAAFVATLASAGAAAAWAMSPDDAIYLTQQDLDDDVIIAKICADGEAWDLTAEDIAYLRDEGVDEDVIEALIDPASAADRYGFRLGDGDRYDDQPYHTAYVFSCGYYYGPIARAYFYDPFFYPYLYCDRFAFSFSYWPSYYAGFYYPYAYGYYAYPYFSCARSSFYSSYDFCGPSYRDYRVRYRDGFADRGNVRWRSWDGSGSGRVADGGKRLNVGGAVERRMRNGDGIAQAPSRRGDDGARFRRRTDLGRVVDRESRTRVERRGDWIPRGSVGERRETSDRAGRAWGRSRGDMVDRPDRSLSRRWEPAPGGGARVYRGGDRESRGESRQIFRMPSRGEDRQVFRGPSRDRSSERQAPPRFERGREFRAPERVREQPQAPPPPSRGSESHGNGWGRGNGDGEPHGNGGGRRR